MIWSFLRLLSSVICWRTWFECARYLSQTSTPHKLLIESLGDWAATTLFEAGERAGQLAAASMPVLVATLRLHLSPQLIRQRFYDLQVFGWATIIALHVNDQFTACVFGWRSVPPSDIMPISHFTVFCSFFSRYAQTGAAARSFAWRCDICAGRR